MTEFAPLTEVGGLYKCAPEDFEVSERLPFVPEGAGEHVYLHIRKRQRNTLDVQRMLAEHAAVSRHQVGYAGLKDKYAVTSQWFSVHLPGVSEPDWRAIEDDAIQLLEVTRHRKKLRTGAHSGNDFRLVVRDIHGDAGALRGGLAQIQQQGFPNFFGEQRFGFDGSNLDAAANFGRVRKGRLSNRQKMILSAVRSFLFNEVLALRMAQGSWCTAVAGDLINLDGSNSFFGPVALDDDLDTRLKALEVHPTGPLPGIGTTGTEAEAALLEAAVMARHGDFMRLLERVEVKQARRSLRACAHELRWQQQEHALLLEFSLNRGVYATEVLRYLGRFRRAERSLPVSSLSVHQADK
jgi:tRNA pseudouridine13 synthase